MPAWRPSFVMALSCLMAIGAQCGDATGGAAVADERRPKKAVFVSIGAANWQDIMQANVPALHRLVRRGAIANVSVRITNRARDAYLSLGAGEGAVSGPTGGFAFNATEPVEHGTAAEAFRRNTGEAPDGQVLVPSVRRVAEANSAQQHGSRPGFLAARLSRAGLKTAVIGNADTTLAPLSAGLALSGRPGTQGPFLEIGREAALAAMDPLGRVAVGDVGRELLEANPAAPFGISTSLPAVIRAFRHALSRASLVVVETGDVARADLYSLGLPEEQRARIRRQGLQLADRQISALLKEVDPATTLFVVLATTSPGGPEIRGQLRPGIVFGAGKGAGFLRSAGTRRNGLVTIPDITATAARHLGIAAGHFGAGHDVRVERPSRGPQWLKNMEQRAATNDRMRAPLSALLIGLEIAIFALGMLYLRRRRFPGWLRFLVVLALALPVLSHLSKTDIWRLGTAGSATVVVAITALAAALFVSAGRRASRLAAVAIPAAGLLFFLIDLALGAPAQLDSVFGYTSVSGGRYYGIGNLGFAMFAASAILLAGVVADRASSMSRPAAVGIILLAAVWTGHPRLGADVGGTLALIPAALVVAARLFKPDALRMRYLPLLFLAGLAVAGVFGVIDLSRGAADRSHLGDFLALISHDPQAAWVIFQRKVLSSLTFGLIPWGLLVPPAIWLFLTVHRNPQIYGELLTRRPGLQAALQGVLLVAVTGSLFNDSGIVVGGMVLAIACPWVLLLSSDVPSGSPHGRLDAPPGKAVFEGAGT